MAQNGRLMVAQWRKMLVRRVLLGAKSSRALASDACAGTRVWHDLVGV